MDFINKQLKNINLF